MGIARRGHGGHTYYFSSTEGRPWKKQSLLTSARMEACADLLACERSVSSETRQCDLLAHLLLDERARLGRQRAAAVLVVDGGGAQQVAHAVARHHVARQLGRLRGRRRSHR